MEQELQVIVSYLTVLGLNSGPLEKQYELLTTEPSLQTFTPFCKDRDYIALPGLKLKRSLRLLSSEIKGACHHDQLFRLKYIYLCLVFRNIVIAHK